MLAVTQKGGQADLKATKNKQQSHLNSQPGCQTLGEGWVALTTEYDHSVQVRDLLASLEIGSFYHL